MPAAGNAAIVFTRMNMLQMLTHRPIAPRNILLFNVGVKCVEENADIGMPHTIAKCGGIGGRIQKESFKAVKRLDSQCDIVLNQDIGNALIALNGATPL